MKYLLFFLSLTFLFTNCNDDLEIVNPTSISEIETIVGHVRFADKVYDENNEPLEGVVVSIYASSNRYTDLTDATGAYDIAVPLGQLPQTGFISVSVNSEAYKPHNLTYEAPLIADEVYGTQTDFLRLSPCPTCIEIGIKSSELIHLGDDNYSGSANSQFQKDTDGVTIEFELEGSAEFTSLNVSFEMKGLQATSFEEGNKSSIQLSSGEDVVSEQLLEMNSPDDGSYEFFMYNVGNEAPITSLKFISRNHGEVGSDYDDWEFTCLYVEGVK